MAGEPEGRLQVCLLEKTSGRDGELGLFSNIILEKVRCCDWLSADLFLVYCVLYLIIVGWDSMRERDSCRELGRERAGKTRARKCVRVRVIMFFEYLATSESR